MEKDTQLVVLLGASAVPVLGLLYAMTKWWFWWLVFFFSALASLFAMIGNIVQLHILAALGFFVLTLVLAGAFLLVHVSGREEQERSSNWAGVSCSVTAPTHRASAAPRGNVSRQDGGGFGDGITWDQRTTMIEAAEAWREYARNCAAAVAHLWNPPPAVKHYLNTDRGSVDAAKEAESSLRKSQSAAQTNAIYSAVFAARAGIVPLDKVRELAESAGKAAAPMLPAEKHEAWIRGRDARLAVLTMPTPNESPN